MTDLGSSLGGSSSPIPSLIRPLWPRLGLTSGEPTSDTRRHWGPCTFHFSHTGQFHSQGQNLVQRLVYMQDHTWSKFHSNNDSKVYAISYFPQVSIHNVIIFMFLNGMSNYLLIFISAEKDGKFNLNYFSIFNVLKWKFNAEISLVLTQKWLIVHLPNTGFLISIQFLIYWENSTINLKWTAVGGFWLR